MSEHNLITAIKENKKRIGVVVFVVSILLLGGLITTQNPSLLGENTQDEPQPDDPVDEPEDTENTDEVDPEPEPDPDPEPDPSPKELQFTLVDSETDSVINTRTDDIYRSGGGWVVTEFDQITYNTIVLSKQSSEEYTELEPNEPVTVDSGTYDVYVNYPRYQIKNTSITISESTPETVKKEITLSEHTYESEPAECNIRYFGEGSRDNPIEISTIYELQCINQLSVEHTYAQQNTIDATPTKEWNGGAGFNPIGYYSESSRTIGTPFIGDYYGNGYEITNLYINRPEQMNVSLFGFIASNENFGSAELNNGPQIQNVTLTNAQITGDKNVGGIIGLGTPLGYNSNYITNNSVSGDISGNNRVNQKYGACYDADDETYETMESCYPE